MRCPKEKSARVLDTPEADSIEVCPTSVFTAEEISNEEPKDYATMRAQFALRGRVLTRSRRVPDGRITYIVTRWNQSRNFSHLHDVQAFLNQVTGVPF